MARGDQGRDIYADDRDRKLWLATLGEACVKTGWRIHAWGALGKRVLAWWLCQHTTVRRRWVSERLGMGDESRVTQAIRRVERADEPGTERLKAELKRIYEARVGVQV